VETLPNQVLKIGNVAKFGRIVSCCVNWSGVSVRLFRQAPIRCPGLETLPNTVAHYRLALISMSRHKVRVRNRFMRLQAVIARFQAYFQAHFQMKLATLDAGSV
jgi:hypothetical protein